MTTAINILLVEDSQADEDLLVRELRRAGFSPTCRRVETEADFLAGLRKRPDIILSDYSMPQFNGLRAAELLRESGLNIPFILISGTVGEEIAVEAMQHGATDYLLKNRLTRLGVAVERALGRKRMLDDRKQKEDELVKAGALQNAIFASANFSCIATDAAGVIQIFNVGAQRMLGYTAAEVVNRITPAALHDPEEMIARAAALSVEFATPIAPGFAALAFKASRGVADIYELTKIRKDGSRFPAVMSVTALRGAYEDVIGYLLIGTDNTARQLAEDERRRFEGELRDSNAELERARAAAERASLAKSEFLSSMSHELRTPLNGIIGFTEFLIDEKPGPLRPKQKEYLGDVLNSGRHLLQLINDVLDLAKIEAGKMELHPETFPVRKAVEEVAAVIQGIAQKKRIPVEIEIGEGLAEVLLDQHKFKQVLYNLLSNAVKFTDPDGRVKITARRLNELLFAVQVSDTGIGIKAEDLNRLFSEFEQLDSGNARRFEGTGLGLALTKKIVEFQGGEISVESHLGRGSVFTVVLPLTTAAMEAA